MNAERVTWPPYTHWQSLPLFHKLSLRNPMMMPLSCDLCLISAVHPRIRHSWEMSSELPGQPSERKQQFENLKMSFKNTEDASMFHFVQSNSAVVTSILEKNNYAGNIQQINCNNSPPQYHHTSTVRSVPTKDLRNHQVSLSWRFPAIRGVQQGFIAKCWGCLLMQKLGNFISPTPTKPSPWPKAFFNAKGSKSW